MGLQADIGNWQNLNLYDRPGVTLQISGVEVDIATFVYESRLPGELVLFKGPLGLPNEIRNKFKKMHLSDVQDFPDPAFLLNLFDRSNLLIDVSRAKDPVSQINDATFFMDKYRDELKILRNYVGIEDVNLRFTTNFNETLATFKDFPSDFYLLVDEIGIQCISYGKSSEKSYRNNTTEFDGQILS